MPAASAPAFGLGTQVPPRVAGAKPARKGLWGYGGVVAAPDGTVWKAATSAKQDTGPAIGRIDDIVLLLGAADVAASKRFYTERGTGSQRIVIAGGAGSFTDPDGFAREGAPRESEAAGIMEGIMEGMHHG